MKFRLFVLLLLSAIFLLQFGLPGFQKFLAGDILIGITHETFDSLDSPAITLCFRNPMTKMGWKGNFSLKLDDWFISKGSCAKFEDGQLHVDCINSQTYDIEEAIDTTDDDLKASFWEESIWYFRIGKCFTLRPKKGKIGYSQIKTLKISLKDSLNYYLIIHDPTFYFPTANPKTFPRILMNIDESFGQKYLYIQSKKHIKMNTQKLPCQEDLGYSFVNCIQEAIAAKVGCSSPWNAKRKSQSCSTNTQL